jgi:hypothetical protein
MTKQCRECGQEIHDRTLRQEVQAHRRRIERTVYKNEHARERVSRMQECYARAEVALAEAEAIWSEQLKAWGIGARRAGEATK